MSPLADADRDGVPCGTRSVGEGLMAGVHVVQVIAGPLVATVGAVVLAGRDGRPRLPAGHRRRWGTQRDDPAGVHRSSGTRDRQP